MSAEVTFQIVGKEPPSDRYRSCRRMLVGPWVNQPDEYEGYNGFVGWAGVTRLRSGRWLVAFASGLWHASCPWTEEIRKDPKCREQFEAWHKMGLPDICIPRGGRSHVMHSDDRGRTWSKPETLIDTDADDISPTIIELDDGTLLCSWVTQSLRRDNCARYMLSGDGGNTWTPPMEIPAEQDRTPFSNYSNGPFIQLADGTVLCVVERAPDISFPNYPISVFRSADRGKTFHLASDLKADHPMYEPTVAELPGGRLIMVARREGDMSFSNDGGRTWRQSNSTGWNIYDPHLLQMPNGVLALFHGSYQTGGIRVLLSPDGGHTWHGPGQRYGYSVDPSVYGYCHATLLPDGTAYVVYLHTGGHRPGDARTEAIWGLRVGVHADAGGIDILPAPGSPADKGRAGDALQDANADGGDPELGNLP